MKIAETLRGALRRIAGVSSAASLATAEKKRRTLPLPSIFNSYGPPGDIMPKPTAYNLRADLTGAQITAVTSTTVSVDTGIAPPSGCGFEVRLNDYGWGQANDRNLLGRFNTQAFSLARLAATQNYFLRLYDSSSPPKYSRYSAALHVDYPL